MKKPQIITKGSTEVVGIIQARMGSSRLPGKTMMNIEGKPLLEHLITRIKKCKTLNDIVIATTDQERDAVIVNLAKKCDVKWFIGSEPDVLDRFVKAAERFKADMVVRICADNPLTSPNEIDKLVNHHLRTGADYSYNNRPHPKGLLDGAGAEIVNLNVLKKISKLATEKRYREHVTLFILENPKLFKIERLDADEKLRRPELRLDVDYEEDLDFIKEIYARLYRPNNLIKLVDVIDLLNEYPELVNLRKKR